ncbi:hypothetical protein FS749_003358 [Ceratobasidium sp. UAMH 11750]|nr:hypothetical protein FS749_003358 [Ceratobasidium sp. UAMH 11750]
MASGSNLLGHTLPSVTTSACDRARQELQAVRSRLSQTIQDYLAACEFMETACSTSNPSSPEREQALLAIDAELSTFGVEEASVWRSRNVLERIRNRSKMVAPVYLVPSEVLARIFSSAACYCSPETGTDDDFVRSTPNPVSVSAVCKRWRQVAINHRALWTHIDLGVCLEPTNRRYHSPNIWVERSQGAPLYITICCCFTFEDILDYPTIPNFNEAYPPPMFDRLLHFLTPLMTQVCSLRVSFSRPEQYLLNLLLELWTMHGTVGYAKVLEVNARHELEPLEISPFNINSATPGPARPYREFFQSLEVLELANTMPAWPELSLRNLVCLNLSAGTDGWHMTQLEFASVLASVPRLQQLNLQLISVSQSDSPLPSPIPLSELQVLNAGGFKGSLMFETILDTINPGPGPLTMRITLPHCSRSPQRDVATLCSFVNRSNVTTLSVNTYDTVPYFASQLGPLPQVQTLVLKGSCLADVALVRRYGSDDSDSYTNPFPIDPELVLWPRLQNLYLHRCALEKEHTRQLIALHPIKSLYVQGCFEGPGWRAGVPYEEYETKSRATCEEYVQFLSGIVPKVVYLKGTWI